MARDTWRNQLAQWVAWKLPKRIVYYAYIRLHANATHVYPTKTPDEVSWNEALKAWVE